MDSRAVIGCVLAAVRKPGKEVKPMRKPLTKQAREQEAAYWAAVKKALSEQPAKVCHK